MAKPASLLYILLLSSWEPDLEVLLVILHNLSIAHMVTVCYVSGSQT